MLFIESRIADLNVEKSLRTPLLEALQERGLVPLIRSSRLHFFEQALMSAERVKDLEQALAVWSDAEGDEPYVRGDVFCFEDFAHFVIFGEDGDGATGLRAGIIYDAETVEPAGKLEAFCRNVQDALESAARESRASTDANMNANANATTNADAVAVGAQSLAGLHQVGSAAPLGAQLHYALVFSRGGDHGLALDDVHADRLLHVDIGAGLDGGDHRQCVPVIGRGDRSCKV